MDRTEVVNGLSAVVDHVNEVVTLLDDTDCNLEAIRWIQTVQVELHQLAMALLEGHLTSCVLVAGQAGGDVTQVLEDIGDLFCWVNKLSQE